MYRNRRTFVRRSRRRAKWMWVHSIENNAAASPQNDIDLLATWRTNLGVTVNLPDITIWRIKLRISIKITIPTVAIDSADAVLATVFVEGTNQAATILNQSLFPYDQHYLLYDGIYAGEAAEASGIVTVGGDYIVVRNYEIKAHRKLQNLDDSLFLQLVQTGNASLVSYSFQQSTLVLVR